MKGVEKVVSSKFFPSSEESRQDLLIAHLTKGKKRVEEAVSSVWRDEERPLSNFSSTMGRAQAGDSPILFASLLTVSSRVQPGSSGQRATFFYG